MKVTQHIVTTVDSVSTTGMSIVVAIVAFIVFGLLLSFIVGVVESRFETVTPIVLWLGLTIVSIMAILSGWLFARWRR
ncbi:MAG: hypothetical protein IT445_15415 [Phycisphaeraceae bacterium]|nr:hypothetical protein [Phycisphaeraceae bacterium]